MWHKMNWLVMTAALVLAAGVVQAETINMVPVGNAGNANDSTGYGGVDYTYNIGKYEVTNAQYNEFLNNADPSGTNPYSLYDGSMGGITFISGNPSGSKYTVISGRGNMPVNWVSFWDACRFANWLNNGQGSLASTETGAYTLTASGTTNNTVTRNADWKWAVTSENEWYKAAFYDPTLNGNAGGYWLYATKSNTEPTVQGPPGNDAVNGSANYNFAVGDLTDVGAYTLHSTSPYGTFDQAGNVDEWNEANTPEGYRGVRGGGYPDFRDTVLSSVRMYASPADDRWDTGFRVVSSPEPGSIALLLAGAVGLLIWRLRRSA